MLHIRVVRSTQAFRGNPADILRGIFDIAGLTVDAVLGVDLKPGSASFLNDLVDTCRAIALSRLIVSGKVIAHGCSRVRQHQMTGLVLFVIGIGKKNRGQLIEGQHAIWFGIVNGFTGRRRFKGCVIWDWILERPGLMPVENLVDKGIGGPAEHPEFMQSWAHVAGPVELFMQPRILESLLLRGDLGIAMALSQLVKHRLGREHARLHGGMTALDLQDV